MLRTKWEADSEIGLHAFSFLCILQRPRISLGLVGLVGFREISLEILSGLRPTNTCKFSASNLFFEFVQVLENHLTVMKGTFLPRPSTI